MSVIFVSLLIALYPVLAADAQYMLDGKVVTQQVYRAGVMGNAGAKLLGEGQYQEAACELRKAVELAPDIASIQYNLGLAEGKLGNSEAASEHLKKAVALNPDLYNGWLSLAALNQATGQLPQAIETYRNFVHRFPKRPEVTKVNSIVQLLERQLNKQSHQAASTKRVDGQDDYFEEINKVSPKRWSFARMPLKVYVESATGVRGFNPGFSLALRKGFEDWASASQGVVNFVFVDEQKGADIICTWTDDRAKLANPAEGAEALTYHDSQSNITKGKILVLTVGLNADRAHTENEIRLICLHEIGHVLGLGGHSTDPNDVMFYSNAFADKEKSLSLRDQQTLRRLYAH